MHLHPIHSFHPHQANGQPHLFVSLRIAYKIHYSKIITNAICLSLSPKNIELFYLSYPIVLFKSILEKRFQNCSFISIIPNANTAQCRSFFSTTAERTFHFQEDLYIPGAPGQIAFTPEYTVRLVSTIQLAFYR